jgi:hypothetical protein
VLERPRAQADGVLHVTGRDVEERDYPLGFDADAGAWSILEGSAEELLTTNNRARIIRYLREYPGAKPADIAEALEIKPDTIRQNLSRMTKDGQVRSNGAGAYRLPPTSTPPDDYQTGIELT